MKTSFTFLTLLILLFASGCSKDSLDCQANHWGGLKIHNNSSENLRVYLDGSLLGNIAINTMAEFKHVSEGYHVIHAEQIDSHAVWDETISINQCDNLNLSFTR